MKLNKRFSAILTGTYISFLIPCVSGQAGPGQMGAYIDRTDIINIIPTTPQAASLGSFTHQGINGATGTPVITIPIYTLVEDGVEVPIFLSYDASGIRLEDIATEVGLKWSLNIGGSLSRVIKGLADDDVNGWLNYSGNGFPCSTWNTKAYCHQVQMEQISNNEIDVVPDLFSYSIGGQSGTFFFERNKTLRKTVTDDVRITPSFNNSGLFTHFTLTDNVGAQYLFGGGMGYLGITEKNTFVSSNTNVQTQFNPRTGNGTVEWKLNTITTRNGKKINFSYETYKFDYTMTNNEIRKLSDGNWENIRYNTKYNIETKLPKTIETDAILITFFYSDAVNANVWKKKLDRIRITYKNTLHSREFNFFYEVKNGCDRFHLTKIVEEGNSATQEKKWEFGYVPGAVQNMNGKDFDFFGYFNGANNQSYTTVQYNHSTGFTDLINSRNVKPSVIIRGVLNEVKYPTGGRTRYHYEANAEIKNDVLYYAPGVRVYKTENFDVNNAVTTKKYSYSGLTGNIRMADNYKWDYIQIYNRINPAVVVTYTFPIENTRAISGYCYETVEVEYCTEIDLSQPIGHENRIYHKVEKYKPNKLNNIIYPRLIERRYYDENKEPVGKTQYQYAQVNQQRLVDGWRVREDYVDAGMELTNCSNDPCDRGIYYMGVYTDYRFTSHSALPITRTTDTEYYGNDSISRYQSFAYDSNLQLNEHTVGMAGVEREYATEYTYPDANNYPQLFNNHIIGLPLTKTVLCRVPETTTGDPSGPINIHTFINDRIKFEYDSKGNVIKYYDFVNDETKDYVSLNEEYSYYAGTGKVKEIKHLDGTYTTYIWSYKSLFPVAEIKNATFNQVKSALNDASETLINRVLTAAQPSTADMNRINSLRTELPNALVTTFTFKPLAGVAVVTNQQGVTLYYEYDRFGRLTEVTAGENCATDGYSKRKIEEYKYNYR
jgi:hypothetical protein